MRYYTDKNIYYTSTDLREKAKKGMGCTEAVGLILYPSFGFARSKLSRWD